MSEKKKNLLEISQEYMDIIENGDPETMFDRLKESSIEFNQKIENTVKFVKTEQAQIEAAKKEVARINRIIKSSENEIEKAKDFMRYCMSTISQTRAGTKLYSVRVQNEPDKLEIDEKRLPDEYFSVKTDRKPDRVAIKDALESGEEIEGAMMVKQDKKRLVIE